MKACVGDMIEVRGRHIDDLPRRGEVLEVRGADGGPPYVMQWDDNPHVCIFFPASDAIAHHFVHQAADSGATSA
jgi:hypothetical protein